MICIPFQTSKTNYSMFIVIQQDNVDRMKQNDPIHINISRRFPPEWSDLPVSDIHIAYASEEDMLTIMELMNRRDLKGAFNFLSRGFKFQPEKGDHDQPYQSPLQN